MIRERQVKLFNGAIKIAADGLSIQSTGVYKRICIPLGPKTEVRKQPKTQTHSS